MKALHIALALMAAAVLLFFTQPVSAQQPSWQTPMTTLEINGEINATVTPSGVAVVNGIYRMSASSYKMFKELYNPLSTFVRQMSRGNTPAYLAEVKVEADDANNLVRLSYRQYGAAVYIGNNRWKLIVTNPGAAADVRLLGREGNRLTLIAIYAATRDMKITETLHLTLPSGARDIEFNREEGVVYYTLALPGSRDSRPLQVAGIALTAVGAALLAYDTRRKEEEEPPPPPPPML